MDRLAALWHLRREHGADGHAQEPNGDLGTARGRANVRLTE
jgi:hypothetical protein